MTSDGAWIGLVEDDSLRVDAWSLEAELARADDRERAGDIEGALDAYRPALDLWTGEPFADVPYAAWAEPVRVRLRSGFTTAGLGR